MYQLWMYFEEGAHTSSSHDDISSHQKITEGDLYSLDLIKKDYEKKALREFLTNNDRNANCREFYIREHGEPTYQIFNIDYRGISRKFRTVYNKEDRDKLVSILESGHKKYNTKMRTIVIPRDDSEARGEIPTCECWKCSGEGSDFNDLPDEI